MKRPLEVCYRPSQTRDAARKLCERQLAYASPRELYAGEIGPHSGRHLGNFPRAFTHLSLINAVVHVIRAEQMLGPGPLGPAPALE